MIAPPTIWSGKMGSVQSLYYFLFFKRLAKFKHIFSFSRFFKREQHLEFKSRIQLFDIFLRILNYANILCRN